MYTLSCSGRQHAAASVLASTGTGGGAAKPDTITRRLQNRCQPQRLYKLGKIGLAGCHRLQPPATGNRLRARPRQAAVMS